MHLHLHQLVDGEKEDDEWKKLKLFRAMLGNPLDQSAEILQSHEQREQFHHIRMLDLRNSQKEFSIELMQHHNQVLFEALQSTIDERNSLRDELKVTKESLKLSLVSLIKKRSTIRHLKELILLMDHSLSQRDKREHFWIACCQKDPHDKIQDEFDQKRREFLAEAAEKDEKRKGERCQSANRRTRVVILPEKEKNPKKTINNLRKSLEISQRVPKRRKNAGSVSVSLVSRRRQPGGVSPVRRTAKEEMEEITKHLMDGYVPPPHHKYTGTCRYSTFNKDRVYSRNERAPFHFFNL